MDYSQMASEEQILKTAEALKNNGFIVQIVATAEEAKQKALELLPEGSEVLNATSITLDQVGLTDEIAKSGKYNAIKNTLAEMNRETQHREMQRMGSAPEYEIGSAHAVTETGQVVIASNTGSQLPGEIFGADHVVWVIGAQKLVKDINQAIERIHTYITPLESVRARKAYGLPDTWNSFASKITIFNREPSAGRTNIILVKQALGF